MANVFWFSCLQPGVKAEDYERWVREVDYVLAKKIPSIVRYRVYRINGACLGDDPAPYDYVEMVEITDIDVYRHEIRNHPAAEKIIAEIRQYVESKGNAWGTVVEG
jgi:TPP-dependent pyruvate/acetoin dehydrogenase alpha subunit